ncbi:MAG TPA: MoxR family ATPase, partial [Anaerolineae bacterium]
MQERQVTIGGETHFVPDPFLVMATQNPIETEGTYPLPEAQVDRFMMKLVIDYPSERDEYVIVERNTSSTLAVRPVITTPQLIDLQRQVEQVYIDPALIEYAVRLATATREPDRFGIKDISQYILYGTSPRASINLIVTGRALAYVRGRNYALLEDVMDMALDVMRHRLVLSYEAMSDNITSDELIRRVLDRVPIPAQPLKSHVEVA